MYLFCANSRPIYERSVNTSGQFVGERKGTAFPFRFRRENAVLLVYATAVGERGERGVCTGWAKKVSHYRPTLVHIVAKY